MLVDGISKCRIGGLAVGVILCTDNGCGDAAFCGPRKSSRIGAVAGDEGNIRVDVAAFAVT